MVEGDGAPFFAALLESLTVGVIACDTEGRIVFVNRPVRDFLSLPDDRAPQDYPRLISEFLHDSGGNRLAWPEGPLHRALRGETVHEDTVLRMPGRRVRTFATTARPVVADGRSLGAVAVAREVTALRRAERFHACHQEVERCLKEASSATEAAPGVLAAVGTALAWPAAELWLVDEQGGELRYAGRWSAPGVDLEGVLGFPPIKGKGITGRVWASGKPLWVPDIADTVTLRSPLDRTRTAVCLRRGIRSVLAVPIRDGDHVLGVLTCYAAAPERHEDLLTVLLDGVAAQIAVFVALRRAEELARQLTRAKDDFIALVGHEMRTPLTSIVANAALLGEETAGLDEDARAMVGTVQRNAAALHEVVDTLLDLAGLDTGYVGLSMRQIDLATIVDEAVAAAGPAAGAAGMRLAACPAEPVWLAGDAYRLRQVVDDLLANAINYSAPGGEVRIRLSSCPEGVQLLVSDDGIGTPAEERARVFDRFYRAANVRHQGIPGKGLGLSRARTIVERHGGTINLTGNHGSGTDVLIRLPFAVAPPRH